MVTESKGIDSCYCSDGTFCFSYSLSFVNGNLSEGELNKSYLIKFGDSNSMDHRYAVLKLNLTSFLRSPPTPSQAMVMEMSNLTPSPHTYYLFVLILGLSWEWYLEYSSYLHYCQSPSMLQQLIRSVNLLSQFKKHEKKNNTHSKLCN